MNHEIMMYGIAQKEQLGFDKAVEECKYRMSRYGVTPNMLILPPQMLLYMALAPEERLTYKEGGPAAEARFEAGVAGYEARAFRGCGIFTSEPYEVSDDADSVQMLTRSSQIGEFYILSPPQVKPANGQYTCDALIYDEESDKHVRIQWGDALDACCIANKAQNGGAALDVADGVDDTAEMANPTDKMGNDATLGAWWDECQKWREVNEADGEVTNWDDLDKDVRIVVARPFIEHLMHNVIMTVSGRDTGATLFGPADMQLSANTQVKTIEGHVSARALAPSTPARLPTTARSPARCLPRAQYTGHFKAVVTKPQNVLIMRDVACAGYVAGCNTTFFARDKGAKTYSLETARQNIQDRLSFADDVGAKYASMLAFPATEQQLEANQGFDTVMSVTSRLLPWEVTGPAARDHSSFPGGQKVYEQYNSKLGLSGVHYGEDMKAAENQVGPASQTRTLPRTLPRTHSHAFSLRAQDFISQGSTNNAICFLGPHRKYDRERCASNAAPTAPQPQPMRTDALRFACSAFTKNFMSLVPGQGQYAAPHSNPTPPLAAHHPTRSPAQLRPRRHPWRRTLASRGERVAQNGPGFDGVARARAARPDGVLQEVSAASAPARFASQQPTPPKKPTTLQVDSGLGDDGGFAWNRGSILKIRVCVCGVGVFLLQSITKTDKHARPFRFAYDMGGPREFTTAARARALVLGASTAPP